MSGNFGASLFPRGGSTSSGLDITYTLVLCLLPDKRRLPVKLHVDGRWLPTLYIYSLYFKK